MANVTGIYRHLISLCGGYHENTGIDADVNNVYPHVLKWEGGYANDPADSGGETYIGIARNSNPGWKGWAIIDTHKPLKKNQIIEDSELMQLHKQYLVANFWNKIHGNDIHSQDVANFIFDLIWGSGYTGLKLANTVVNRLTGKGLKEYNTDTVDAINNIDSQKLLEALYNARKKFLETLVEKRPKDAKFLQGWMNRLNSVTGRALTIIKSNPVKSGAAALGIAGAVALAIIMLNKKN